MQIRLVAPNLDIKDVEEKNKNNYLNKLALQPRHVIVDKNAVTVCVIWEKKKQKGQKWGGRRTDKLKSVGFK